MTTMKNTILNVPDFPKKGILFRDISPLLASPKDFQKAIDGMIKGVDMGQIDAVAGVESRGFILAAAIAAKHGKGFIPIRKSGKLPPPVEFHAYTLEYGEGVLEVKRGTGRLLVVDDVLATGGTIDAAIKVCAKAGYEVKDAAVLIDLKYLNNYTWQAQGGPRKVRTVVEYTE